MADSKKYISKVYVDNNTYDICDRRLDEFIEVTEEEINALFATNSEAVAE